MKPLRAQEGESEMEAQASLVDEVISCSLASTGQAAIWRRGDLWQNTAQQSCMDAIARLESEFQGKPLDSANLYGRWKLIFANDDVTRSSPLFWALRGGFLMDFGLVDSFLGILDAVGSIAWAIGDAFQTITDEKLVSEVEVKNFSGSSIFTTVSRWNLSQQRFLEITVETTRQAESTLRKVLPGFDQIEFPSGVALETTKPGSSTVLAQLTFLSDQLRVTRHADKVYVYQKCSDEVP